MADPPDRRNRVGVTAARALRLAVALAVVVATGLLAASALATGKLRAEPPVAVRSGARGRERVPRCARPRSAERVPSALDRSARQHSLEMGRDGYFAHPSADGTAFWKRIRHYYPAKGHSYWSVGENLLWRSPSVTASQGMDLWIASPEHLKNLLATQWRQIGISAVHVARPRASSGACPPSRSSPPTSASGANGPGARRGTRRRSRPEPADRRTERQPEVEDAVGEDG